MTESLHTSVVAKLRVYLSTILKLGPDIEIKPDVELVEQIGLDSIEAFDAIATLHDLLGVTIPHDFKPSSAATLNSLASYVIETFGEETAQRLAELDLSDAALSEPQAL